MQTWHLEYGLSDHLVDDREVHLKCNGNGGRLHSFYIRIGAVNISVGNIDCDAIKGQNTSIGYINSVCGQSNII